jgi:cysteinyl-tRNA synthetase
MLELEAQQDATTVGDSRKEDPLDFPLWKSSRAGEPRWDGPWGRGRPGWHIECSTLVLKHLGTQVDIHGGGADLIYPHHECEIVQSETITGVRPFARVWMHVAMVRLGGRKMSKSDGNLVFVRDLLGRYTADAVRLYLLATPYREPLDFDEPRLAESAGRAATIAAAALGPAARMGRGAVNAEPARERFDRALADDLDVPTAIGVLEDLASDIAVGSRAGRATFGAQRALRLMASGIGLQLVAGDPPSGAGGRAAPGEPG